jgi:nucleoside-diphosphate-sugar epimerase
VDWAAAHVLVTGGASFIGSHLVDALIARGGRVRVVDDLSSGHRENLAQHEDGGRVELLVGDLLDTAVVTAAMRGIDVVFHLAADHGGRGYVDLHQAACAGNFALDGNVFRGARTAHVQKVVFASSGCVYPNFLQSDLDKEIYLTEEMVGPPYDPDNMYGFAKLTGELTLTAYAREWGMKTASCRYFTVYGDRGHENHAVIAMIARALVRQDPYVVWGTGEQIRNWTHVSDIVSGTIAAAEHIDDGAAVNLGTMERTRVIDAVHMILGATGHRPAIQLRPDMPTGPLNRVADNAKARRLLGWEPRVKFVDGVRATMEWYARAKNVDTIRRDLDRLLTERS